MKTKMISNWKIERVSSTSHYPVLSFLVMSFLKRWYQQIGNEKYHSPYYHIGRTEYGKLAPKLDKILEKVGNDILANDHLFQSGKDKKIYDNINESFRRINCPLM